MMVDESAEDSGLGLDAQTELFLQLAELVGATTRTGPVLALACERLATIIGCTRVSVFLVIDGQVVPRMSRFADGMTMPEQWDQFRTTVAASHPPPVVIEVLEHGMPIVRSAYDDDWWAEQFGVASIMAVPVGKASHPLGVLVADSQVPCDFKPDQVRLAAALGVQLGGIVALARQIEEQNSRLDIAEAVHNFVVEGSLATSTLGVAQALARAVSNALGYTATLAVALDATGSVTEFAGSGVDPIMLSEMSSTLTGEVVTSVLAGGDAAGPCLLQEMALDEKMSCALTFLGFGAGWCIPVSRLNGQVVGVVIAGDPTNRGVIGHRHRDLVGVLAQESTVIVENAVLREHDHFQATHDMLTGLANRAEFEEYLTRAIAVAERTSTPLAVLLLDLNRFKDVNDTLGHHMGDELLRQVATCLTFVMREADLVARLGGDEFVVLLTTSGDIVGARAAAKRLVAALEQPLLVANRSIWIGASVGIACFPEHGTDPQTLLHRADLAMYEAKRTTVGVVAYDARVDRAQSTVPGLLLELPRAIQNNELLLHYQPKLDLNTGLVVGVEALVRWAHPTLGLLGPDQFVPLAEATGIIRQLTSWVLITALRQVATWREHGLILGMAVNVSARDLADPSLPERVMSALCEAGVPVDQLTLELTESAIMSDEAKGTQVLTELRALGVRISLDDFGTGYSSLAYLERLPLDEVKIDRSFLGQDGFGAESFVIRSMVKMGHHLGLRIVVEGVENMVSHESVARINCDELQGFVLSPPLAVADFERWLTDWTDEIADEPFASS